jgi:glycosyltransferase involved in cell wall biosynthesis
VELADKMYFLLKNPDVTEKMSREAKRICRMEFSISKMVKEYENLYQELARNRP